MKALIYLRQSRDATGEEHAIARQRAACRRLAKQRGWAVIGEHIDNDISAAGKRRRPGFEALLSDVLASGGPVAIVATELTRLTRNARDTLRILEIGEAHKTVLAFVRDSEMDLGTSGGRMTASILAAVARQEIERKSERQADALAQAVDAGRWAGGRRPFGYESNGVTLRPDEADALRTAYRDVLGGAPLARVARKLTAAGFATPQPRRDGSPSAWTAQTIGSTLRNPRFAGLRAVRSRPERGRGSWTIVGRSEWPAVVDEDTWRAVDALLGDSARRSPARGGQALLTGVATCGVCGGRVNAGGATAGQDRIYRCATAAHVVRRQGPVDDWVRALVRAYLTKPSSRALLTPPRDDQAARKARSELTALRTRRKSLAKLLADGILDEHEVRVEARDLDTKIAAASEALTDPTVSPILRRVLSADDVGAALDALDVDEMRDVIAGVVSVTIRSPGRGARNFDESTVVVTPIFAN